MTLAYSPGVQASLPVIFVPGIKGSGLIDEKQNAVWLTLGQSLALQTPPLALPLTWESADQQSRDKITPSVVLDEICLIPRLLCISIYHRPLTALTAQVFPFAYDWRRDNLENLDELERFVLAKRELVNGQRFVLVAHSLGGLLGWALLIRHPDWFSTAFFAGVPFKAGIGFLPDLTEGTANGLNRRILDPATVATFPSVYAFFPERTADLDFYAPHTWESHGWGLFEDPQVKREQARLFLEYALPRAQQFRRLVQTPLTLPFPVHVIASRATETLKVFDLKPDGQPNFKSGPPCQGDGRVCLDDAQPPVTVPSHLHLTRQEHADLFNDQEIIDLIQSSR